MLASIIENSSKLLGLKSSLTINLVETLYHKGEYETTSELAPFKQIKTPELREMLDDLIESERYFPMVWDWFFLEWLISSTLFSNLIWILSNILSYTSGREA